MAQLFTAAAAAVSRLGVLAKREGEGEETRTSAREETIAEEFSNDPEFEALPFDEQTRTITAYSESTISLSCFLYFGRCFVIWLSVLCDVIVTTVEKGLLVPVAGLVKSRAGGAKSPPLGRASWAASVSPSLPLPEAPVIAALGLGDHVRRFGQVAAGGAVRGCG